MTDANAQLQYEHVYHIPEVTNTKSITYHLTPALEKNGAPDTYEQDNNRR